MTAAPVVAIPVIPLTKLAKLWEVSVRQCADALKAHGVPVTHAKGTEVRLVRLADLTALFAATPEADKVLVEPETADDVLASLGLRRTA